MKNKTTTYFLLSAVLLVWGLIFYKILSGLKEEYLEISTSNTTIVPDTETEEEKSISLLPPYRDPFLTIPLQVAAEQKQRGQFSSNKNAAALSPIPDWTFVRYLGLVSNKTTRKKVGLIVLREKDYMVYENEFIQEIKILKITRDSIYIVCNRKKKWIRR